MTKKSSTTDHNPTEGEDHFPTQTLLCAKEIMDMCKIKHRTEWNRWLAKINVTKNPELKQRGRQLFTKKVANRIVDLRRDFIAGTLKEMENFQTLKTWFDAHKSTVSQRHYQTQKDIKEVNNLIASYNIPDVLDYVKKSKVRLDNQSDQISHNHSSLMKIIESQGQTIENQKQRLAELTSVVQNINVALKTGEKAE